MVDRKPSHRWLKITLSVLLAVFLFPMGDAFARYRERPKRHFLSWESRQRPDQYRRLKSYTKSNRRFDLDRRRVVNLKKTTFWNVRPYQFSTPVIVGDRIYVGVDAGYFYAIDAKLSRKLWTFETEGAVQAAAAADETGVFVGDCKANVYAMAAETGSELWRAKLDTTIMAAPLISGNRVYVSTMSGRLYALDRATGGELWHTDANERSFGFSVRRQASPVLYNGMVLVGSSSGLLVAFRENDGQAAWAKQLGDKRSQLFDVDSKPLLIDNRLYVTTADGNLTCIDVGNGDVLWEADAGGVNDPLYHEGRVYVSDGGVLSAVDAVNGHMIWQQEFDEPALSSPAGGLHYISVAATTDKLYIVDSETGDVLFERYIRKGSYGDPVIVGDMLYVLSNSGRLFTFKVIEKAPRKERLAKKKKSEL